MARERFENMWNAMRTNNLLIEGDIDVDLICLICKSMMINACNGPCGCRYCWDCLVQYLNGTEKPCPGKSKLCQDEMINIHKNTQIDHPTNVKISKAIIKCTQSGCQFKCELNQLADHLTVCDKRTVECPYSYIGCSHVKLSIKQIDEHLSKGSHTHALLMFKWIDKSRNDMVLLKNCITELRLENYNVNVKLEKMRQDDELNKTKISILENNERELINATAEMKHKNAFMIEEMNFIKSDLDDKHTSIEGLQKEISQLRQENETLENKVDETLRKDAENWEEFDKKIKEMQSQIKNVNDKILERVQRRAVYLESKIRDVAKHVDKQNEYVWNIDNWTNKIIQAKNGTNRVLYSKPFYSYRNGYKMCLQVYPNGNCDCKGTCLSIYFCLMRGRYDNVLSWPFNHDVTFSLVNQETGLSQVTKTVKNTHEPNHVALIKPTSEINIGYGYSEFMKLDELLYNPSLIIDDSIFITFNVHQVS